MQSLDVISFNVWQILISLCNLLIMFLILKKFLFKPVQKMLAERQAAIDGQYADAAEDKERAAADRAEWEQKMTDAKRQAEDVVKTATAAAERRGEQIVAEAQEKADRIVRQAEAQAVLERQKAQDAVKQEIVDVSALLAEKMLQREIKTADHRTLIDSFIEGIDDN